MQGIKIATVFELSPAASLRQSNLSGKQGGLFKHSKEKNLC